MEEETRILCLKRDYIEALGLVRGAVFQYLMGQWDCQPNLDDEGYSPISNRHLEEHLGLSSQTRRNAINALEKSGLIHTKKERGKTWFCPVENPYAISISRAFDKVLKPINTENGNSSIKSDSSGASSLARAHARASRVREEDIYLLRARARTPARSSLKKDYHSCLSEASRMRARARRKLKENLSKGTPGKYTSDLMPEEPKTSQQFEKSAFLQAAELIAMVKYSQSIINTPRETIERWALEIESFAIETNMPPSRCRRAARWLADHTGIKYVPSVFSARDFVEKFAKIEAARERLEQDNIFAPSVQPNSESDAVASTLGLESTKVAENLPSLRDFYKHLSKSLSKRAGSERSYQEDCASLYGPSPDQRFYFEVWPHQFDKFLGAYVSWLATQDGKYITPGAFKPSSGMLLQYLRSLSADFKVKLV